jgi:hypothetical protein
LFDEGNRRIGEVVPQIQTACLIPRFDGATLSFGWKKTLLASFVAEAPLTRTPSPLRKRPVCLLCR